MQNFRCRRHRRRRCRAVLRRRRRPARPEGAADRPRREGGREDPHLRRRPLQLHQPRPRSARAAQALPGREPATSAARRCRATRRRISSRWCSATASPSTKSTRASCSATARPKTSSSMLLRECEAGGVTHWQPCARAATIAHVAARRYRTADRPRPGRRAPRRHRHRRPVDPEDRRHRLRLSHRAPVRPAHRGAAPGPGAADLRWRELGALFAAGGLVAAGAPSRPAQKKDRMVFHEDLLFTHRGLSGPGGAADLQLLAPKAQPHTHRPGARGRPVPGAAAAPRPPRASSSPTNWPPGCPRAWPMPGCSRTPPGSGRSTRAATRPWPRWPSAWRAGHWCPPAAKATARPR